MNVFSSRLFLPVATFLGVLTVLLASNVSAAEAPKVAAQAATAEVVSASPRVLFDTSMGNIVVELDPKAAPKTVDNFLQYVRDKHYDGTIFHRVIPGFMVQGGGFTSDYTQKATRAPVNNEADNGLKNTRGSIAMARTNAPHSATSQFFINAKDNDFLNYSAPTAQGYGYTVFGKVVEGMDIVEKIEKTPTGSGGPFRSDVPREVVLIKQARILP